MKSAFLLYLMPFPISQLLRRSACSELDRILAKIQMNIEVAIYHLNCKEIILKLRKELLRAPKIPMSDKNTFTIV